MTTPQPFSTAERDALDTVFGLPSSSWDWQNATYALLMAAYEDITAFDADNLRSTVSATVGNDGYLKQLDEFRRLPMPLQFAALEMFALEPTERVEKVRQLLTAGLDTLPHYDMLLAIRSLQRAAKAYEDALQARKDTAKAKRDAEAAEAAAAKSEEAALLGLVPLTGTPAQRKWAEEIRANAMATLPAERVEKHLKRATTAKWWIEHRTEMGWKDKRR